MQMLRRLIMATPRLVGSPYSFLLAIALVSGWVVWGIVGGFDNPWLLWPSAVASVVTFLIVFSLQYTQNRDTRARPLNLDEITRAPEGEETELVKLETLSDEQLSEVESEIVRLRQG